MEKIIKVDFNATRHFLTTGQIEEAFGNALKAFDTLESREGKGSEFLGWLDLPSTTGKSLIGEIESVSERWKKRDRNSSCYWNRRVIPWRKSCH